MIKARVKITFPATPEEFIRYQERLVGRELSEREKEVTAAWVDIFNRAHMEGLRQNQTALDDFLARVDEWAGETAAGSAVHRFLLAARWWISAAWEQGAKRSFSK